MEAESRVPTNLIPICKAGCGDLLKSTSLPSRLAVQTGETGIYRYKVKVYAVFLHKNNTSTHSLFFPFFIQQETKRQLSIFSLQCTYVHENVFRDDKANEEATSTGTGTRVPMKLHGQQNQTHELSVVGKEQQHSGTHAHYIKLLNERPR
ncbi:hypothetical protein CBL_14252 [Carabus blaptoides fortunei]